MRAVSQVKNIQQEMLDTLKSMDGKLAQLQTAFEPPPKKNVKESERDASIHHLLESK